MDMRGLAVAALIAGSACMGAPSSQTGAPAPAGPAIGTKQAVDPRTTSSPIASPTSGSPPRSAGAVPDAGILFVQGADDRIYRYDGLSGRLDPVWGKSTFDNETSAGTFALGRHGGATLLRWDGSLVDVPCGSGMAVDVAGSGACASAGSGGVLVAFPGDARPRLVLPPDWGALSVTWSPDGARLLLVRGIRPRPGPGMDPGLSALWLMEGDGGLREIYRPSGRGSLTRPMWSPDGRHALVWLYETTSNSFAADGVGVTTILVDVASGAVTSLGAVMQRGAVSWSRDGRLAFVRGAGRQTWWDKQLVLRAADGTERVFAPAPDEARVALLPAWDVATGRLAWVSGPAVNDYSGAGYIDGLGAGKRTAVIDDGGTRREVTCAEGRVVEGVRWSADGTRLLLLCRVPGKDPHPLELWLYRLADGTSDRLVTGLVGAPPEAGGFGYYGAQPPLSALSAWSLAVR